MIYAHFKFLLHCTNGAKNKEGETDSVMYTIANEIAEEVVQHGDFC